MRAVCLLGLAVAGCVGPTDGPAIWDATAAEDEPSPPPPPRPRDAARGLDPEPDAAIARPTDAAAIGGPADMGRTVDGAAPLAPDAGAARDGAPAAPAVDCKSAAVVCDDFEDGDLQGWTRSETGGRLEVEATHAYSGKNAVRLTIPAGQRGGFLMRRGAPLFPLPRKVLWGRLMIFYQDMAQGHFDTIRGATSGGGTPWYNIGGQGKAFFLNYFTGGSDCWAVPAGRPAVPRNKWMCWEWMFDGNANRIQFWVDGQLMKEVTGRGDGCIGANTWTAPTFGSVLLGEFNAQTHSAQTQMWMDDIAMGTEARVGCPAVSPAAH